MHATLVEGFFVNELQAADLMRFDEMKASFVSIHLAVFWCFSNVKCIYFITIIKSVDGDDKDHPMNNSCITFEYFLCLIGYILGDLKKHRHNTGKEKKKKIRLETLENKKR